MGNPESLDHRRSSPNPQEWWADLHLWLLALSFCRIQWDWAAPRRCLPCSLCEAHLHLLSPSCPCGSSFVSAAGSCGFCRAGQKRNCLSRLAGSWEKDASCQWLSRCWKGLRSESKIWCYTFGRCCWCARSGWAGFLSGWMNWQGQSSTEKRGDEPMVNYLGQRWSYGRVRCGWPPGRYSGTNLPLSGLYSVVLLESYQILAPCQRWWLFGYSCSRYTLGLGCSPHRDCLCFQDSAWQHLCWLRSRSWLAWSSIDIDFDDFIIENFYYFCFYTLKSLFYSAYCSNFGCFYCLLNFGTMTSYWNWSHSCLQWRRPYSCPFALVQHLLLVERSAFVSGLALLHHRCCLNSYLRRSSWAISSCLRCASWIGASSFRCWWVDSWCKGGGYQKMMLLQPWLLRWIFLYFDYAWVEMHLGWPNATDSISTPHSWY